MDFNNGLNAVKPFQFYTCVLQEIIQKLCPLFCMRICDYKCVFIDGKNISKTVVFPADLLITWDTAGRLCCSCFPGVLRVSAVMCSS